MSYKVLVVDDNIHNSKLIEGILLAEKTKYEVFFTEDGMEGFNKAKEILPDLILMDLQMPEVSGMESLKLMQNDADLKEVPVIFITAYKTPENFSEAFKLGAFDFISEGICAFFAIQCQCVCVNEFFAITSLGCSFNG